MKMVHLSDSSSLYSLFILKKYCEKENFKGWDPYDGLNSKVFRATPLKNSRLSRLAWIQIFKRSPVNLRRIFQVPKDYNSKGIALFLSGYVNIYKSVKCSEEQFGKKKEIENKIDELANLLIDLQTSGYTGACWGYNFDWQNRVFFQPAYTPTVVATSFCANALFDAYDVTGNEKYLEVALSSARFISNDLNKLDYENHLMLSYSPLDKSIVYNASFLGARLLARCWTYNQNKSYKNLAGEIVKGCLSGQKKDGSWFYGVAKNQKWIDSFHTGFNLECLWEYMYYTGDISVKNNFDEGMSFYLDNFFLDNGVPKYYHDKIYPIDIHSPAQFAVTLAKTKMLNKYGLLLDKTIHWTIREMQDEKGFFYYQLKRGVSSRIPYMRWAQAWMFYALSYLCHSENDE